MHLSKKILGILISAFLCSCADKTADAKISITAKRVDGSAVAEASVYIDSEKIGETNAFGTFSETIKLPTGQRYQLRITHDDATYYYSPHHETFHIRANEKNAVTVSATMYLAPKPKKLSKPGPINDTSKFEVDQNNPSAAQPKSTGLDLVLIPLEADYFLPDIDVSEEKNSVDSSHMFTVHVHNGGAPIEDAEVSWTEDIYTVKSCTTNARGRCVLHKSSSFSKDGSLLVRKRGYESVLKSVQPQESQSIRVKLEPGQTIDAQLLEASLSDARPISYGTVRGKNGIRLTSDKNGYIAIPQQAEKIEILTAGPTSTITLPLPTGSEQLWTLRLVLTDTITQPQYEIYPIHIYRDAITTIKPEFLNYISDALKSASTGIELDHWPKYEGFVGQKRIGILPIAENVESGLKLSMLMIDPKSETIISDQIERIRYSRDDIYAETKNLFSRLATQAPVWGLIENSNENQLKVRIEASRVQEGESLLVKSDSKTLKAIVTSRAKNHVIARVEEKIGADLGWKITGAPVFTETHGSTKAVDIAELKSRLTLRNPEFYPIDLARKHLAEKNPEAAIEELHITDKDTVTIKILKLNESAQAKIQLGDLRGALKLINEATVYALNNKFEKALMILEANSLYIRAHIHPIISADKDILSSLTELSSDVSRLLTPAKQGEREDDMLLATLEYTALLLNQKSALVARDTSQLNAVEDSWTNFLSSLKLKKMSVKQIENLEHAVNRVRQFSRAELSSKTTKI